MKRSGHLCSESLVRCLHPFDCARAACGHSTLPLSCIQIQLLQADTVAGDGRLCPVKDRFAYAWLHCCTQLSSSYPQILALVRWTAAVLYPLRSGYDLRRGKPAKRHSRQCKKRISETQKYTEENRRTVPRKPCTPWLYYTVSRWHSLVEVVAASLRLDRAVDCSGPPQLLRTKGRGPATSSRVVTGGAGDRVGADRRWSRFVYALNNFVLDCCLPDRAHVDRWEYCYAN
jgi:hypothetical protein